MESEISVTKPHFSNSGLCLVSGSNGYGIEGEDVVTGIENCKR